MQDTVGVSKVRVVSTIGVVGAVSKVRMVSVVSEYSGCAEHRSVVAQ